MSKNVYILPYLGTGTRKICHGITLKKNRAKIGINKMAAPNDPNFVL